MTRKQQWFLAFGIVAIAASAIGITRYGLRDELDPVDVGSSAPNFESASLFTRQKHTFDAEYKGQVVLLNIWATWCAPCRAEMPTLEALYRDFGPKGLRIIAVNTMDLASDSTVQKFANEYGLTFDVMRDMPSAGRDSVTAIYKVTGYPESFVIDKSGVIRKKWALQDDWNSPANRALIADLLGIPVPPMPPVVGGDTAVRGRKR